MWVTYLKNGVRVQRRRQVRAGNECGTRAGYAGNECGARASASTCERPCFFAVYFIFYRAGLFFILFSIARATGNEADEIINTTATGL